MKSLRNTVVVLGILLCGVTGANAEDSALVDLLTRQLGVSTVQAEGGAGAIFKAAKERLSPTEYTQVSDAIPEATSLLDAAPKPRTDSGIGGSMGGVTSALGGKGSSLGGTAKAVGSMGALSESFSSLGMTPDMAGKFIPVVLDYAKSKGGSTVMNLLKNALM